MSSCLSPLLRCDPFSVHVSFTDIVPNGHPVFFFLACLSSVLFLQCVLLRFSSYAHTFSVDAVIVLDACVTLVVPVIIIIIIIVTSFAPISLKIKLGSRLSFSPEGCKEGYYWLSVAV